MELTEITEQNTTVLGHSSSTQSVGSSPTPTNAVEDAKDMATFADAENNTVTLPARRSLCQISECGPHGVVTPPLSPNNVPHRYSPDQCGCLDCLEVERQLLSDTSPVLAKDDIKTKSQPKMKPKTMHKPDTIAAAPSVQEDKKDDKPADKLAKPTDEAPPAKKKRKGGKKADDDLIRSILSLKTLSITERQKAAALPVSAAPSSLATVPKRKRNRAEEVTTPRKQRKKDTTSTSAMMIDAPPNAPPHGEDDIAQVERQEDFWPPPSSQFEPFRGNNPIISIKLTGIIEIRISNPPPFEPGRFY